MRSGDALSGERARYPLPEVRTRPLKLLNRLAASPWALSCTSFVLTALLIRSNGLNFF
jgi:hypothetical protein